MCEKDFPVCPSCRCHCDIIHTATVYHDTDTVDDMVIMIIDSEGKILYYNENATLYEIDNMFAFCSNCGAERILHFQQLLAN